MRIAEQWIGAPGLQDLLRVLAEGGHRALLVGGCVRNALLGQPVADIDVATDAPPLRVTMLATDAGLRVVPTGIDHGTVTVLADDAAYEVTTFRRDVETDGRRARVAFSDRLEEDAARRDFTMNALYAEADGRLIDPLGGLADLRAGRVRFVGQAADRIREDYLRILRLFRFQAWYGREPLSAETLATVAHLAGGLDRLSRERVGHEMRRLLAAPDPVAAVEAMAGVGVLARVLQGAAPDALARLVAIEAPHGPDWLRRLAMLASADTAQSLRLSRAEARQFQDLLAAADGDNSPAELGWRMGAAAARDALLVRAARHAQPMPDAWDVEVARGVQAEFPLKAADLMPGLSGPALGARLRMLEARWIDSDFTLSREQLLA